jgi:MFS family permease
VKNRNLLLIAFVAALGGYLFGFDFAVISGALPFLERQFSLDVYAEGFVTGSLALGAIGGCLLAGYFSDRWGRRPALLLAAAIFLFSSLGMAAAPARDLFIVARFCAGIGVGMASVISPMYIAEIAPAGKRGRLVAINQLTIVTGILVTNLVNFSLRHLGSEAWRWMFGLGAIPAFLFLVGAWWLPESPRWTRPENKSGWDGGFSGVCKKTVLPVVAIGIVLAMFQQFCGINVVFNYTPKIFESIGASKDDQLLQTVFIGAINLCCTVFAMVLVDRWGRKPLMLAGAGGLAILYLLVAYQLHLGTASVAWSLLAAIGLYAMTLAPVTWVLISEIFPDGVRGAATSVAVVSLWLAYFVLIFTFPILFGRLKENTFYIYAGVCALGFLFVWRMVRESKGKPLGQAEGAVIRHQ